jgi:hypothetical protein
MIAPVGSEPGPEAEHESTAGQVIQENRSLGDHVRVVVRHAGHAGPELDVPRALGGGGDEYLRAGDDLRPRRVVLADPGFVVAELVEVRDQVEVAFQRQGRVLTGRVERRHEDSEAKTIRH